MKKIERPDWVFDEHSFNDWFDEHIEPLNKMLDDAIEVYSDKTIEPKGFWSNNYNPKIDTHTAWVINIQPIKEETADEILQDALDYLEGKKGNVTTESLKEMLNKAKRALDEKA